MHLQRLMTPFFLLALATASAPTPAHAGGVVSVCDEVHLRAALAGGGAVTFSCSGTITLTATIVISADTTIDGSGQAVTLSGNHAVRVFTVNSGVTLNLDRLTVANGSALAGGGIYNNGTLIVSNSTFSGNRADADTGGGSYWQEGGGIYNKGTLTVSNSTFSGNSAGGGNYYLQEGGGIVNYGKLTVNNSTFSGNSAEYRGSGIYEPEVDGGAISNRIGGTLIASNSTFSGNSAEWGGAIYNDDTVIVTNSVFFGNSAIAGGGIYTDSGGRR